MGRIQVQEGQVQDWKKEKVRAQKGTEFQAASKGTTQTISYVNKKNYMKCVVLDLEFTELVPDENLEDSSLRIACAATLLSDCFEPLLWTPSEHESSLNQGVLTHLIS
jgi:hypothetical protein